MDLRAAVLSFALTLLAAPFAEAAPPDVNGWMMIETSDEMRQVETLMACKQSVENLNPGAPYKAGPLSFCVSQDEPRGSVPVMTMITLTEGLFDCIKTCRVDARFDEGEVLSFTATTDRNYSLLMISPVSQEISFLLKFMAAKKAIIEVPLYPTGRQQASFQAGGLSLPLRDMLPKKSTSPAK